MDTITEIMKAKHKHNSPCKLTVTLNKSGQFLASMTFAPGMEPAHGRGDSAEEALKALNAILTESLL